MDRPIDSQLAQEGDERRWNYRQVADSVSSDLSRALGESDAAPSARAVSALRSRPRPQGGGEKIARIGLVLAAGFVGVAGGLIVADRRALGSGAETDAVKAEAAVPLPAETYNVLAPPAPVETPPPVVAPTPVAPAAAEKALPPVAAKARQASAPSHRDVLAAERRLRRAYDRAIDAGVPNAVLLDVRNRWARLNRSGARDPQRLVSGYEDMAAALDRRVRARRG